MSRHYQIEDRNGKFHYLYAPKISVEDGVVVILTDAGDVIAMFSHPISVLENTPAMPYNSFCEP